MTIRVRPCELCAKGSSSAQSDCALSGWTCRKVAIFLEFFRVRTIVLKRRLHIPDIAPFLLVGLLRVGRSESEMAAQQSYLCMLHRAAKTLLLIGRSRFAASAISGELDAFPLVVHSASPCPNQGTAPPRIVRYLVAAAVQFGCFAQVDPSLQQDLALARF